MFYNCKNLINLLLFDNNAKEIKDKSDMFYRCDYVKKEDKDKF